MEGPLKVQESDLPPPEQTKGGKGPLIMIQAKARHLGSVPAKHSQLGTF